MVQEKDEQEDHPYPSSKLQDNYNDVNILKRGDFLLLTLLGVLGRGVPPNLTWQFLTVRDRVQLPLVSHTVRRHLRQVDYTHCKDGKWYRVPFPGFPGLLKERDGCGLFPHQLASLRQMHEFENNPCSSSLSSVTEDYGALRGGILADAPGLGKTITLLALICQTAGRRPRTPPEFWNEQDLQDGWNGFKQNPGAMQDMTRTIACFRRLDGVLMEDQTRPERHGSYKNRRTSNKNTKNISLFRWIESQVLPPLPASKFPTMRDFESFVRNAVRGHATEAELELFRFYLCRLKAGMHKSHRKLLHTPAGRRMTWERALVPTSATLLIVPDALLEHWFQQIHQHIDLSLFASANNEQQDDEVISNTDDDNWIHRGIVFLDGVGDMAEARMPLGHVHMDSKQLPVPWQLAQYMIVVTTFSRCQAEYQKEVNAGRLGGAGPDSIGRKKRSFSRKSIDQNDINNDDDGDDENGETIYGTHSSVVASRESPFLKMRWLRIVVDEGHELGTSSHKENSKSNEGLVRFIHQMAAERRWVLSGTPTSGDPDDKAFTAKGLDQLQRLLLFLRHPGYGAVAPPKETETLSQYVHNSRTEKSRRSLSKMSQKVKAKMAWTDEIKDPFLHKQPEARLRLVALLKSVMVMHRKEDILLPKPIFHQIEVNVPLPKKVQENIRQSNESGLLLLNDYLRTNDFQSLVDRAQGTYIVESIRKAQKALDERGGPMRNNAPVAVRMLAADDVKGKPSNKILSSKVNGRPIKAVVYSSNKHNLRDVTEVLYSELEWENIAEAYDDNRFDCSSELSRFRHDRKECRTCPICGFQNDNAGKNRSSSNQRGRGAEPKCSRRLMEVVDRNNQRTRFLIEPERVVRSIPLSQGGNVMLERLNGMSHFDYGLSNRSWRVGDILEVNIEDPHPLLKKRLSMDDWQGYGSNECMKLAEYDGYMGKDWFFGPLPVPAAQLENGGEAAPRTMEVVLFKWQPCNTFHNPTWYKGPKLSQVPLESVRENVFVLSLDAGLSHGLDLSFVTHIFLLEPVDDAALLEQITSRAHRLGATGPVTVETVNPFFEVDQETELAVEMSREHQKHLAAASMKKRRSSCGRQENVAGQLPPPSPIKDRKNRDSSLTKVVCQYCYRQFDSYARAERHEAKQCPRNPANANVVDPWHLSSVYREIRPPPALTASGRLAQEE